MSTCSFSQSAAHVFSEVVSSSLTRHVLGSHTRVSYQEENQQVPDFTTRAWKGKGFELSMMLFGASDVKDVREMLVYSEFLDRYNGEEPLKKRVMDLERAVQEKVHDHTCRISITSKLPTALCGTTHS